jgi:FAD/FMN-containing dehydrogenase
MYPDPAMTDKARGWVRGYYEALEPHSDQAGYINFMDDDDQGRIKANYKGNYERLAGIKKKYDPGNLFHMNQNIKPA